MDRSNGYEEVAAEFIARRERSTIGLALVRGWARTLPRGATILDLGCGPGVPIALALIQDGFVLFGIDASPALVAAFQDRLPGVPVACEPAETSGFFDRTFDAILAVGLLFLLGEDPQRAVIRRAAGHLSTGGRFLFTSPAQPCTWIDVLTGRESRSLGANAYEAALAEAGLSVIGEYEDEGGNHYYDARR